ncbi:lyase family protein [Glycomyces rhizosphaerae]|uniref:Lyase family protein n=1 Tax=Glycomyces rhizosphaerae TaxID=2054422 RepID=A0ABV7Q1M9_9ACTN
MSELFGPMFARGKAAETVTDRAWLQAMLEAEVALAAAAASWQAVPSDSAEAIRKAADPERFDIGEVARSTARIGNPVGGVVDRLRELVGPEHAAAVHHRATSQDILDTAMMLVARDAVTTVAEDLAACERASIDLHHRAGETRMIGRTLLQQAVPVRSAALFAQWRNALQLARDQLEGLEYFASYSGPVGSVGNDGLDPRVMLAFAQTLELTPSFDWHTVRSPVVRIAAAAAESAGTCGKIAVDIILLSQNEIGEVGEARGGGSTSMPHKHNPVAATAARACATRTPGLVSTLYAAMPQELQRSPGLWHSEWEALTDLLRLTGSAAAWLRESLEGLRIHPEAMQRNLEGGPA